MSKIKVSHTYSSRMLFQNTPFISFFVVVVNYLFLFDTFFTFQVNIWKSLTQDKVLAEFLLEHVLKKIDRSCLISEVTDRNTCKTFNEVTHEPLAAIVALSLCFGTKEMESIIETEFAR